MTGDEAAAVEVLDAIRLVLATDAYDAKKVKVIERLLDEPDLPFINPDGTSSVARFIRAIPDPPREGE